jgi:hypothetical protein
MFGAMMSALNPIPTLRQYKRLGVVRTVTHNHLQGGYRACLVLRIVQHSSVAEHVQMITD